MADSGIIGRAHLRLVDGEVKGHNAITAVGSGSGVGIIARLVVGLTIPCVTIASGDSLLGADGWGNGQMKDMLDTINVGTNVFLNMGVCTCGAIVLVVPLIRQLGVADCDGLLVGCACAKDSEVENVDSTVASNSHVLLYIGVLSCSVERLSAPSIGKLVATDSDTLGLGDSGWQDSEAERSGTIAALLVGEGDTILAFCRVGLTIPSVSLAMADSGIIGRANLGLVDGEVKGHNAITAVGSSGGVGIITRLVVGLTIPCVTIASGDSLLGADGWGNGQMKDMLDTINVGTNVFLNMGVCTCGAIVLVVPLIRQLGIADCDGLLVGSACGEDSEIENVDGTIASNSHVLLYIGV